MASVSGKIIGSVLARMAEGVVETMMENGGKIYLTAFYQAFADCGLSEEFANLVARRLEAQVLIIQVKNVLYLTAKCVRCETPYPAIEDSDHCKGCR